MEGYIDSEKTVFAFNIWDINSAKAVIDAACNTNNNIILQTSASIYKKIDVESIQRFVKYYSEKNNIKVWLHLDHCKDIDMIKEAIDKKYDSIMIDASDMELEKNINIINRVVDIAHKKNVLVESELGQIKGVEDNISYNGDSVVQYKEIDTFLKNANMDMVAVAFGNAHGIYKGTPKLNYDIVRYVTDKTNRPFVVHGGSGMSDEILKKLISINGVKKINISTDIKLAYREGILTAIKNGTFDKQGFQAVSVENDINNAIAKVAEAKLRLLDGKC